MNSRAALIALLLLPFSALSTYAIMQVGYWGIFEAAMAGPGAWQLFADLVIMGLLVCVWMVRDAKQRGANAWPFVLLTFATGSFGPLLYLIMREWSRDGAQSASALAR